MNRRKFVAAAVGAMAYRTLPGRLDTAQRALHIRAVVRRDTDVFRGLDFGAAEASRSAALFGWNVSLVPDTDRVHAIILGVVGRPPDPSVPVLRVVADPDANGDGTFAIAPDPSTSMLAWHAGLERFGAQQLNDRYRAATGRSMNADAWAAWFAVKVITDSVLRVRSTDSDRLLAYLRHPDTHFDGHKGVPLRFGADGRLVQPLYEAAATKPPA